MHMHADSDGDGKLTKEEINAMFARIDKDNDGSITMAEWKEYLAKSGLSKDKCDVLEEVFRQLDQDGSGTISREEFEAKFHIDYGARYARGAVAAFLTKGRFIAYTSDIGESARPVMPSWFVNGCYALTFLYVAVSVGHHTQEAHSGGASQAMVLRAFTHSATFELLASVAMPSLIIHQAVHFAQNHAHRLPAGPLSRWAPTAVGLCCIPFLPYLDPPAEKAIDAAFEYAWPVDGTMPTKEHHE
uniref:Mitochondrial fission process protein 1 n=1 Tax=Prymnesium polylepis TaxID=72548 RepID=A0A7S4IZQ1_9EUKA